MSIITRFEHPASLDAPEMFLLRAERDLSLEVLEDQVGDLDLAETPELIFSCGVHPQYRRQVRLIASDAVHPGCEADVLGMAILDLPMADNPRLANLFVTVRRDRRGEGIGSTLHAAALEVAAQYHRSAIHSWTWEPLRIPAGARELAAETGSGSVEAGSAGTRFLTRNGYVLGQTERLSRLNLPGAEDRLRKREQVLAGKPTDYEVISIHGRIPETLLKDVAVLCAAMAADVPKGAMDLEDEVWDAARVRASDDEAEVANRDQLWTFVRHLPSGRLAGFTRLVRDRTSTGVAYQWDTLVVAGHRGHGLGMLMKVVNHGAAAETWPDVSRLITGNASENSPMLAINVAIGYEPYAASGFWELRSGALG